ncbi:hypothetical protein RBB77_12835 [Tunturibacter psychrotolerans]|uniref:Uncharacterized protein n=1 Tax=Tunturiibacter psychrotolerans TaxID=3069686 RepID=A0AAU7ZKZ1_9BACT
MKLNATRSPDLLRRFVATPYVFADCVGPSRYSVRSNDLGIALAVRRSWSTQRAENLPAVVSWQLIREVFAANDNAETTLLSGGELRTLIVGTETVLFYDAQRSEFLGFVSSAITIKHLVSELIPTLLKI